MTCELVTLADYEDRFGCSTGTPEAVLLAIGDAVGLARRCAGTQLCREQDTVVLDGHLRRVLILPDKPVWAVTKVVEDGVELDPAIYELQPRQGLLRRRAGVWSASSWQNVAIDWDHGLDPIPADLVGMIAGAANSAMVAPRGTGNVASETWGTHTVAFRQETGSWVGFTKLQEARLRSYGVGTVGIGASLPG
jgi:hypothetical protein